MHTKAAKTSLFIIQTVAPIFNKKGYAATSLSDLTGATGLTKGAIYGNFKDKEALAIAALNYSVKQLLLRIQEKFGQDQSPLQKLFILINFYRHYDSFMKEFGGCPLLNNTVDANEVYPVLSEHVQHSIHKMHVGISNIIEDGKKTAEIKSNIDSKKYAKIIFSMIKGAIFMYASSKDDSYLKEMMNRIDQIIINEIKK